MRRALLHDRSFPAVRELLPHGPSMILIDRIMDCSDEFVECAVVVGEKDVGMSRNGSAPNWVGLEYMAQTAAVLAGLLARGKGDTVRTGFVVGSRRIECLCQGFAKGLHLRVRARLASDGEAFKSFDCEIRDLNNETLLQRGQINVYLQAEQQRQ